jgi:hypothetical protein
MADGSLSGMTQVPVRGGVVEIPNTGDLIRAKAKHGNRRIAMLLDLRTDRQPRGWLIAVWDEETGGECQLSLS